MPCSRGQVGFNGERCPYVESRAKTIEEIQAFEIIQLCSDQLRIAPSGHVIGLDMNVVYTTVAAKGYDMAIMVDLLPVAAAGLVAAVSEQAGSEEE